MNMDFGFSASGDPVSPGTATLGPAALLRDNRIARLLFAVVLVFMAFALVNVETASATYRKPTLTTIASSSVSLGGAIYDTAYLSNGYNPKGTITFKLYGPNDDCCTGAPIFTATVTVNGNGSYVSPLYT